MKRHKWILFSCVLLLATTFRIIYPLHVIPGFDQVQILDNAQKILGGDLTLIGPRTGPAQMFTGPLIYYISSAFIFLFGEVYSMILVPLLISLLTGVILFCYSSRYFSNKLAWIILIFWAFSPFLVHFERLFWNPNLILVSAVLLFFPLISDKPKKLEYISIFVGSFLAYQAHFSGFLLFGLVIVSILFLRKSFKLLIPLIIGLCMSLLPTILFDIRNNFLNVQGLLYLFQSESEFDLSNILLDVINNLYIIIETTGKIFLFYNSKWTIVTVGIMFLIGGILLLKRGVKIQQSYLWILIVALSYAFYGSNKPEYYFLILIPALLLISAKVLISTPSVFLVCFLIFFMMSSTLNNFSTFSKNTGLTIKNILAIKSYLEPGLVKNIVYDVTFGNDFGIKYFLRDIQLKPLGLTFHVVSPNNNTFSSMKKISDVGIWAEVNSSSMKQLLTPKYILGNSAEYFLYRDYYPGLPEDNYDRYVIIKNDKIVGILSVVKNDADFEWIKNCQNTDPNKMVGNWIRVGENQFFQNFSGYCVRVSTNEPILKVGIFLQ